MVAHFSSFPARGAGREQPSLAFPNKYCSTNLCEVFGVCWGENRKGFLTEGAGRVWKGKIPPADREFFIPLRRSPATSQPPVSRVNLQGRCGIWGWAVHAFIVQFCSQQLLCPLPGAVLASSCKTHSRERSGCKYCYFNRLVWGFCWCISTGDEHDFGLIVMATVAAVLLSPCEHRPGQAPAYEP